MQLASLLRPSIRSAPAEPLHCGSYVTDGRRLFRVVSQFASLGEHAFASLEDCLTLEVRAYAPSELRGMGLRPIQTADMQAMSATGGDRS